MGDVRFDNEIKHLIRLKKILDNDKILPIRIEIKRESLNFRTFTLTIKGISSLIDNPEIYSNYLSSQFHTFWNIPIGYPWTGFPNIIFGQPIPFHPHIYRSGSICWGTLFGAQPDYALADWLRCIIEYLVLNDNSLIRINSQSPANSDANSWWMKNKKNLYKYVSTLDMARLRYWIDRTRG